jgi:chloride channel 7
VEEVKTIVKHIPHHHSFTDAEKALMNTYESLDYDPLHSQIYKKYIHDLNVEAGKKCNSICLSKWTTYALVGIIVGSFAYLCAIAVEFLLDFKFEQTNEFIKRDEMVGGYIVYALINVTFVAIATSLVSFVEPVAAGSGIPELKSYLNGTNYLKLLRLKTLVCKLIGVTFSVSGGLIIGKEGPMVHSGAVLAANLSHLTGMRKHSWTHGFLYRFRNDRDKRDFVSGGAAAGVAAAFGAPIGGVLFSLEEAASYWSVSLTWMCMFAAMLGTFTLNLWKYIGDPKALFGGLISFGPATANHYNVWETPFFLLLAVFGGSFGALFNSINAKICHWRRDNLSGLRKAKAFEAIFIALITATCAYWLPAIFNNCVDIPNTVAPAHQVNVEAVGVEKFYIQYNCNATQFNPMATSIFGGSEIVIKGFFHNEGRYDILSLFVYTIVIFILAVITYGIAVPSGLFVPCILIGCGFGRLFGEVMKHHVFPDANVAAGPYALMGAVAMLGGVSRMTISLTVILMETTQNVQFLLPIMLVLTVSKWVGDFFNISLYDLHVELKCMPFVESTPPTGMESLNAIDVSSRLVKSLKMKPKVIDIVETIKSNTHGGYPILNENGVFQGFILRNQLAVILQFCARKQNLNELKYQDFSTTLQSKRIAIPDIFLNNAENSLTNKIIDLTQYVDQHPLTVHNNFPLVKVYTLFRSLGLRHLCVLDSDNKVQGILTRKELMTAFDRDLF